MQRLPVKPIKKANDKNMDLEAIVIIAVFFAFLAMVIFMLASAPIATVRY